jgi:hypothetical protein
VRGAWCVLRPLRPLRGCTFSNVRLIRMESYVGFYDQFIVGGYVFVCERWCSNGCVSSPTYRGKTAPGVGSGSRSPPSTFPHLFFFFFFFFLKRFYSSCMYPKYIK